MELDLQVSPEKNMSREVELGCETEFDFFRFELFLNSSATDIVLVTAQAGTTVETAIARCTSRWAMARGHRLNTSIVLAAVHGRAITLSSPPPPCP